MEKQVLSIEQCKELVSLGVDMSDAKLCWIQYTHPLTKNISKEVVIDDVHKYDFYICSYIDKSTTIEIPTYTLQDILEKLPEEIYENNKKEYFYIHITLQWHGCIIEYRNNTKIIPIILKSYRGHYMDVAFNILKWCFENKYI